MKKDVRLNVYLSHAGVCSRRAADELIKAGEITINHAIVINPGYKVQEKDTVRYKKQVITQPQAESITIALNKPSGYVTTVSDDKGRTTILDLLGKELNEVRLYPIGRLDINTSGIILLTNDGDLAQKLAHPRYNAKKMYQVTLDKPLSDADFATIKKGLYLKDGKAKTDDIQVGFHAYTVRITLHSGKNRIVRRIFETLNYTVKKLDRVSFAGIAKRGIRLGHYRALTKAEIESLKKF